MNRHQYCKQLNIWKNEKIFEFKDINSDSYHERFTLLRCNRHKFILPDEIDYTDEVFYKEVTINKYWAEKEYTLDYCFQNSVLDLDIVDSDIISAIEKQCIITTFHIGSFFSIVSAVSKINPHTCIVIDDKTYKNKISDINYVANRFSIDKMEVINIETLDGFNKLIEGVTKGASLCFFIDGNSGLQGVNNKQNNIEIPFFNSSIYVKTGIPYLSYMFSLPIIQLFTIRNENLDNIYFSKGIIIPTNKTERNQYIKNTTFSIWNNFIDILKKYPTQWEGWLYLHRFHIKWSNYSSQLAVDTSKYILSPKYDLYCRENKFYVYNYDNEMRFAVSEYIYKIFWKLKANNAYLTIDTLNHYIKELHIRDTLIENSILIHPNLDNV